MKVFTLCIDGLEAKLVKRWKLKGLMQKDWGIHDVYSIVKSEGKIYTPIIWGAFLLGRSPLQKGFTYREMFKRRMKAGYGILYPFYVLRMKLLGGRKLGLRKYLIKVGLFDLDRIKKQAAEIEKLPDKLREKTIVEEVKKLGYRVWIKEFPSFNEDKIAQFRAYMSIYFSEDLQTRLKHLEEVYSLTLSLFEEAVGAFKTNDLVLFYSPLIDYANHMLYRPKKLKPMFHLATFYRRMDKMIERLSKQLNSNEVILVVSDHGYDPIKHEHSKYGFWSSSVILETKPRFITDFKSIILDLLKKDGNFLLSHK